ncbi:uncharacterized protein LOC130943458 isoform X1 [Arachis stenosperma]|uniref:uncharacterized protein LOC130943458 isoform X1 n=1 Tax=Arachis stenosperma TaxID=217475 RepID=UPI0025AC53FB|nr:uncharacterized protein LOC130943458 isoform X1 [Arachis stenosperma]XP_057727323.1 uncharacterized protein LOC130943458 isoform X1 [Arachis stenosperma]XP_057727324.1 uncharacterized protein LOC130943458 isoform X1 [Arachis stenosperma]
MAMDVKGIAWVGNVYQKFENMCLEMEEMMLQDTVKYMEDQMQTVGENVKKIYAGVMKDLLPLSLCDLDEKAVSELPIDHHTDDSSLEMTSQGSEKITVKADAKETAEDSRVNFDVDIAAIRDESCDANPLFESDAGDFVQVGNSYIKSNLGGDENQQSKMPSTNAASEITSLASDRGRCSTSQACELSDEKQNHEVNFSNPPSSEVKSPASDALCCAEIESSSTEQIYNAPASVKPAEKKEMNMGCSSSSVLFGDSDGFSMIRAIESDEYSHDTVVVSHPEIPGAWSSDATMIDTVQQDDEQNLDETCIMVTRDELQLAPKTGGNLENNKKKRRQPFSLSKKSARKQEYKELVIWHGNNDEEEDVVKNSCPSSVKDHKNSQLPDVSEPEWELL